jgi:hypothetical protein
MPVPRVRFTVRRLMVAVVVIAILSLLAVRSWERRRRLHELALARHVEALGFFTHDDASFHNGELGFHELRYSLLALMDAERDLWGAKVAAGNHLVRLKAYRADVKSNPRLCYDSSFLLELKTSLAEAEYWAAREE